LLFNLYHPLHIYFPTEKEKDLRPKSYEEITSFENNLKFSYLVEREIVKCKRTVFMASEDDINREVQFLRNNYPDIQFFKSSEQFLTMQRFWSFSETDKTMANSITHLIQFGIHKIKLEPDFLFYSHKYRVNLTLKNTLTAHNNNKF